MRPPAVSVIIPTHNYARFLGATLESVVDQTLADWEALVVDDGSDDEPASVVERLCDERISFLRQERQGASSARNSGLKRARAPVIAFLDADDVWENRFLEIMLAAILSHPESPYACCGYGFLDEAGGRYPRTVLAPALFSNWVDNLRLARNPLLHSVVCQRSLCETLGGFDTSLGSREDWDLWLRAAAYCNTTPTMVRAPLALYRLHPDSQSSNLQSRITATRRILAKHAVAFVEAGYDPEEVETTALATAHVACVVDSLIRGDHPGAVRWLAAGLEECPGLAGRPDIVYELLCGRQCHGERGMIERLDVRASLAEALQLVDEVAGTWDETRRSPDWRTLRARIYFQAADFARVQGQYALSRDNLRLAFTSDPQRAFTRHGLVSIVRSLTHR